jgi:hypothetical protein
MTTPTGGVLDAAVHTEELGFLRIVRAALRVLGQSQVGAGALAEWADGPFASVACGAMNLFRVLIEQVVYVVQARVIDQGGSERHPVLSLNGLNTLDWTGAWSRWHSFVLMEGNSHHAAGRSKHAMLIDGGTVGEHETVVNGVCLSLRGCDMTLLLGGAMDEAVDEVAMLNIVILNLGGPDTDSIDKHRDSSQVRRIHNLSQGRHALFVENCRSGHGVISFI